MRDEAMSVDAFFFPANFPSCQLYFLLNNFRPPRGTRYALV
jgi:hypothetical protein